MTTKIELEKMRFYAYHGVMPQETKVGNDFVEIGRASCRERVWSSDVCSSDLCRTPS